MPAIYNFQRLFILLPLMVCICAHEWIPMHSFCKLYFSFLKFIHSIKFVWTSCTIWIARMKEIHLFKQELFCQLDFMHYAAVVFSNNLCFRLDQRFAVIWTKCPNHFHPHHISSLIMLQFLKKTCSMKSQKTRRSVFEKWLLIGKPFQRAPICTLHVRQRLIIDVFLSSRQPNRS